MLFITPPFTDPCLIRLGYAQISLENNLIDDEGVVAFATAMKSGKMLHDNLDMVHMRLRIEYVQMYRQDWHYRAAHRC